MKKYIFSKFVVRKRKAFSKSLLVVGVCALINACVSNGPEYVPISEGGENGYSSQKLNSDTFRITFSGSPGTPVNRVQDYALLRAAELAVVNGYNKFTIEDETVTPVNAPSQGPEIIVEPTVHTSCGLLGCTSSPYTPSYSVLDAGLPAQRQQFISSLVVVYAEDAQDKQDAVYYNAKEVIKSIRSAIST